MGKKIVDDLKQEDMVKENAISNNHNVTLRNKIIFETTSKIDISYKMDSSGVGGYGLNII